MILLAPGHRILKETVASVILREEDDKQEPMKVSLSDFDDVTYEVNVDHENLTTLVVTMECPVLQQQMGKPLGDAACEALADVFGGLFQMQDGRVVVTVDVTQIGDDREDLVNKLSTVKGIALGGMFDYYYKALKDGTPRDQPVEFNIRNDTTVYLVPGDGRVTTIYAINFSNHDDRNIAKVFMQEMVTARKTLRRAPPVNWSTDPPLELKEKFGVTENNRHLGYISFAVLTEHCADKNRKEIIHILSTFRSFLQYHLKMSKSYWHSKMRARTADLLKVLNRAKVEDPNAQSNKKTASGRTFKR